MSQKAIMKREIILKILGILKENIKANKSILKEIKLPAQKVLRKMQIKQLKAKKKYLNLLLI